MKEAFKAVDGGNGVPAYDIVLSEQTLQNILQYKSDIASGKATPGDRLKQALDETGVPPARVTAQDFIQALLATKQPMIFAESAIKCDGTDWTHRELGILGDINITMKAKFYDNGVWDPAHKDFREHKPPLDGQLMFTPGPLLGVGKSFNGISPDYAEVVSGKSIDQTKYNALMERRLLPILSHANECAKADGRKAVITLPGIGCGAFAGAFKGRMGAHLNEALKTMLEKHGESLSHIACVYFDPFAECGNQQKDIHGIKYRVRPATLNPGKAQLCAPSVYGEAGDDFSGCKLYKIVAWDHASYPGNDFFGNSRMTDDGVSAAATNSMECMTGLRGSYMGGMYMPPRGYESWDDVVADKGIRIVARDNVKVITNDATCMTLVEYEKSAAASPAPRLANKTGLK
jgi:hypothetical protein